MDFDEVHLKQALSGKTMGNPLVFFCETSSTNLQALRLADKGAGEGTVVIADGQTNGRGRLKRSWVSPQGVNLYASIILRPALQLGRMAALTIMTGIAVAELLEPYCPGRVALKWPNDVLIGGRKICGILAEARSEGIHARFVVLGIGLNINMRKESMEPSIVGLATSLREETGRDQSRLELTLNLLEKVEKFYHILKDDGLTAFSDLWRRYSLMTDRSVEVTGGGDTVEGRAMGIDDSGALIVLDGEGNEKRVFAGDASLV